MGNCYSEEEFAKILKKVKEKEITLLIDEAYYYFYPKTFIKFALENEHIFVTRTFSKLFSLAGCRLGYVVGWPEGIKMVQKMCTPHNTNAFALLFAEEMIKNPGLVDYLINDFQEGRKYLLSALSNKGYKYKGEAGNFLFIKPKNKSTDFIVKTMKEKHKILIKQYLSIGELGNVLRVTIGNKDIMQQFFAALVDIDVEE